EVRTITVDLNQKALFAVADGWQRVGVATDTVIIPQQRAQDREYRAGYPGFMLERQPDRVNDVDRYHSSQTPLVENRFSGTWRPGYKHPEMDGLIERFVTTIPLQERMDVLRQLVAHMTDQVVMMGLFYDVTPTMIANRLKNVSPARGGASQSWNAHEWELR
ncbi:MAG: hypothetical protein HW416_3861, partial [Chloroflexi bacterium]|nr:hypothetical protein [Chloroflexota bacterium]